MIILLLFLCVTPTQSTDDEALAEVACACSGNGCDPLDSTESCTSKFGKADYINQFFNLCPLSWVSTFPWTFSCFDDFSLFLNIGPFQGSATRQRMSTRTRYTTMRVAALEPTLCATCASLASTMGGVLQWSAATLHYVIGTWTPS